MNTFKQWAIAVGLVLLLSFDGWGCAGADDLDRIPGMCDFEAGVADIHMFDPLNIYPDIDSATFSADEGSYLCQQSVSYANGVGLRMSCTDSDPVGFCTLRGVCLDADTQELFRCEGTLVFE
jgi:hypothetical protein